MMTMDFEQSGLSDCWKIDRPCCSAMARFVDPPMKLMALQAAVTADGVLYWVSVKMIWASVP